MGDDMGEGMQCSDHPYRSNPGGICAFCLQEKLGKLVSSSKSNPFLPAPAPPSSSSSPPSFRSDGGAAGVGGMGGPSSGAASRRTKLPFLSAGGHKTKKKTGGSAGSTSGGGRKVSTATAAVSSSSPRPSYNLSIHHGSGNAAVLKRSKSVAPRPAGGLAVESGIMEAVDSPRKKSFWSFLSLTSSSSSSSSSGNRGRSSSSSREGVGGATDSGGRHPRQRQQKGGHARNSSAAAAAAVVLARGEAKATATPRADNPAVGVAQEEAEESPNGSQASSSFGRKVARSRSVGCGSRSFSGDFLERISTGFGDCTLRRVESQREAKPKMMLHNHHHHDEQQGFKERVRCGGIFGMISSSPYWLSATVDGDLDSNSRLGARGGSTPCGRSRSWSWALASPMRAFRPSSSKPYAIAAAHKACAANAISSINNSSVGVGDANTSNKGISSDGSGGDRVGDAPSLLAVRG